MANVIRPPCFDRPPVANPHKRRRKGTISLAARRREREMLKALPPIGTKPYDFPLTPKEWVPISIDGDIGAIRLIRALQSEGLMMTDGKIVDWPVEPEDVHISDLLRKIINELAPDELVEALEAVKAIKARRGRAS